MFIIDGEKIESIRKRLHDADQARLCVEDVKKVLEIKETLYWRADVGTCCAGPALPIHLFGQVRLLEATLQALGEGDTDRAAALFDEFAAEPEYTR